MVFVALAALALAASTTHAQFAPFDPAFDGELWSVRHSITPANAGVPVGSAFIDGVLFVADASNQTVVAYDATTGLLIPKPGAQWDGSDPSSPVAGLVPNQLARVIARVDGVDRTVLLVSDRASNRVAAFTTDGAHLFTLRLVRPIADPVGSLSINEITMTSGARFNFTTATSTLTLTGNLAVGWSEQELVGAENSGALVYEPSATFTYAANEFAVSASAVLTGRELEPVVGNSRQHTFGVAFDPAGNLFVLDPFTERLSVYGPTFAPLFNFGTPVADGTSAEFSEPWGMAFWPDATGTSGRLLIADTYNNRILVYRPADTDNDGAIDALNLETSIKNFPLNLDKLEFVSLSVDPVLNKIALTDGLSSVQILQRSSLTAFNLQLLDEGDGVIDSVCTGTPYKVRFSLTVPAGMSSVSNVQPVLSVDGAPDATTFPAATLGAGQVLTYTYNLTAPGIAGNVDFVAGATASTTDVLTAHASLAVGDCAGETDPSTITAVPLHPPQVSGWTPVFDNETFSVTLHAQDDDRINAIAYLLSGANPGGDAPIEVPFDGTQTDVQTIVPIPNPGRTTLKYRVRDDNMIWSGWQTLNVRTKLVTTHTNLEEVNVEFRIGDPEGPVSYTAVGVPPGVTFSTSTGQFAGLISNQASNPYAASEPAKSGIYTVTVTEKNDVTNETSQVSFTWNIIHVNHQPVIQPPILPAINKGQYFEFQVPGYDPDGDPVIFTAVGRSHPSGLELPPSVSINPVTGVISGVFPEEAEGDYTIGVGLAECSIQMPTPPCDGPPLPGSRLANVLDVAVPVLDINQPPDITNPGPQTSAEGTAVTLSVHASDPEGDAIFFQASGLPPGLAINSSTGVISGTIAPNAAATYAVTVAVNDHVNLETRSVTFSWVVSHTNRPPTITLVPFTHIEGDTVNRFVAGTDPDGDALTYTVTGQPPGVVMSPSGVFTGSLDFQSAGVYAVTVTVSDGKAQTSATFQWTVLNTNRFPVYEPGARFSAEGDVISVFLGATDPDGDSLEYSALGLPPGLTLDPATGHVTGTLSYTSAGTYEVFIGVTDHKDAILRSFVWTVTDTNQPPVAPPIANQTNTEGDIVNLPPIAVTDPDGDTVFTFGAVDLPPGLSINPLTGAITGTLPYTAANVYPVSVTVADAHGASSTVSFTWTVKNVNRAPTITAADRTNAENDSVSYATTASDPDGDTLTYTATGLPTGISINEATGTIAGTLSYTTAGVYHPTITVSDGTVSVSAPFAWTVTNVNVPPLPLPDVASVVQGQSVSINVLGNDSDPDGQTLTLVSVSTPSSGTALISNGMIVFTATSPTVTGDVTFNYTVSDGVTTASSSVKVTITPSNQPPVCTAAAASPGVLWPPNHRQEYITIGGVTDPDGGTPAIKFTSILQDEATNGTGDGDTLIDGGIENNGALAWVRAERRGDEHAVYYGRVYILGFTATDNKGASCTGTVFVGVPHDQGQGNVVIPSPGRWNSTTGALVTAPPPIANDDAFSTKKGAAVAAAVQANDVFYGAVAMTIAAAPASGTGTVAVNAAAGTITYTPPTGWKGTTSFTYRLTNTAGSDTALVSVTVK